MENILIMDSSQILRSQWKRALKKAGFSVVEARSGNQLFDQLIIESIDLIVMDLYFEQEQGYHLIKRLKNDPIYAQIPVVVASEERRRVSIEEILKLGIADYLLKPLPANKLVNRVQRVFQQSKFA